MGRVVRQRGMAAGKGVRLAGEWGRGRVQGADAGGGRGWMSDCGMCGGLAARAGKCCGCIEGDLIAVGAKITWGLDGGCVG